MEKIKFTSIHGAAFWSGFNYYIGRFQWDILVHSNYMNFLIQKWFPDYFLVYYY